jgi:alpha-N-arabinofuranosidase
VKYGDADLVDASATWDEENGRAAFFLANRGLDEAAEVTVTLRGFDTARITRAEVLTVPEGADRFTSNNEQNQDRVTLKPLSDVTADSGTLHATLPPLSWAVIETEVTKA